MEVADQTQTQTQTPSQSPGIPPASPPDQPPKRGRQRSPGKLVAYDANQRKRFLDRRPLRRRKQSLTGVMSLVLGALGVVMFLAGLPLKSNNEGTASVIFIGVASAAWGIGLVGIVLSIVGVRTRHRKRHVALTGLILNPLVVVGFALLLWWPTPLMLVTAAATGNLENVQRAVKLGVSPNAAAWIDLGNGRQSATALTAAARHNRVEVVRFLLSKNPDVDQRDLNGLTPLFHAVLEGHNEISKMLLQHGAGPNVACNGHTPLYQAASLGRLAIILDLIEHGALVNGGRDMPLAAAATSGHTTVIQRLLQHGAVINEKDPNGNTALHDAAKNGHYHVVQAILQHDADPDLANRFGETALELAINAGHDRVARLLVNAPTHIDIFTAVGLDDLNRLDLLLEQDSSLVHATKRDETPLHLAARRGLYHMTLKLLQHGADVNARMAPHTGSTPLHLAVLEGHTGVAQVLLDKGADPNLTFTNNDVVGPPLYFSVIAGHLELIELLLKYGAEINAHYKAGGVDGTPLYFAVRSGQQEVAELLLAHQVDVNERVDDLSPTPLYEAVRWADFKMVQLLIEHGADVKAAVRQGTALDLAEDRRHRDPATYERIIDLLQRNRSAPSS